VPFREDIPIRYIIAESSKLASRATAFHVLSEADHALLRCFMTLLQLPSTVGDLKPAQRPFSQAISRVLRLPSFRKVGTDKMLPSEIWDDMRSSALLIVLMGETVPVWLGSLAEQGHVGVLTPSEHVQRELRATSGLHTGLLKGMEDLRESYRVLEELFASASEGHFDEAVRATCREMTGRDLFGSRPRLEFIPGLPLPPPSNGRPAAYLLNRLSNNVDAPSLMPDAPEGGLTVVPSLYDWCKRACGALALLEMGEPLPSSVDLSRDTLRDHYAFLTDPGVSSKRKYDRLIVLGRRVAGEKPIEEPMCVFPVPRKDLVQGAGPSSVTLDPHSKRATRAAVRALAHFVEGNRKPSGTLEEIKAYEEAWRTLETEQRLIACQASWLAGGAHAAPIQLTPRPSHLWAALDDLSAALIHNSRKVTQLFQSVELLLARSLPNGLLKHLDAGSAPVIFYSDLPYEWTMLDNWPVCLTRPVSRIPIGFSHWDVLAAALEHEAIIDTKRPEKVLVFTLIEEHDPVRGDSDAFASSSMHLGQHYTYATPKTASEFAEILSKTDADIVVLDAHGGYDAERDELCIELAGKPVDIEELLPPIRVPPVWILSACHTSVTGAMKGCFVRALLRHGAVSVVASLSRVDAFIASIFVGRLLTDIFNPPRPEAYRTFHEVFFVTQYTTALLYDPLLPFFRLAKKDQEVKARLGAVLTEFFNWTRGRELDIRLYRHEIAWFIGEAMLRHGLQSVQIGHAVSGAVKPETLLFSVFGVPSHVTLK
jgi:hypothetical protein